jgi:hypothetical protein
MMGGDGGGDCGAGDAFIHSGDGAGGEGVDGGHAKQPHPFDERPKINGELTIDQMHE